MAMKLQLNYTAVLQDIAVNGEKFMRMKIADPEYPTLEIAGASYFLKEVHMHLGPDTEKGSEHILTGSVTPVEVQFFHVKDSSKDIIGSISEVDSVVALSVLYKVGGNTPGPVDAAFASMLSIADKTGEGVILSHLLPQPIKRFFLYNGSFTNPPCIEGVKWIVLAEALNIQPDTLDDIQNMAKAGFRPAHAPMQKVECYEAQ